MNDEMICRLTRVLRLLMRILNMVFSLQMAVIGIPCITAAFVRLYRNDPGFSSSINKILISGTSNPVGVGNISAIAVVIWTASFAFITLYIQGLGKKELGIPVVDIIRVRVGGLYWFHMAVVVFALEMGFLLVAVIRDSLSMTTLLTFVQVCNLIIVYWNLIVMTTMVHVKETIDMEGEKLLDKFSNTYIGDALKTRWQQLLLYKILRGIDLKDQYLHEEALGCIIRFLEKAEQKRCKIMKQKEKEEEEKKAGRKKKKRISDYTDYVNCVNAVVFYIVRSVYVSHPGDDGVKVFIKELFCRLRKLSLNSEGQEVENVFSNSWRIVLWNLMIEQDEYEFSKDLVKCEIPGIKTNDEEMQTRKTWLGSVVNKCQRTYKKKFASDIMIDLEVRQEDCSVQLWRWGYCCESF